MDPNELADRIKHEGLMAADFEDYHVIIDSLRLKAALDWLETRAGKLELFYDGSALALALGSMESRNSTLEAILALKAKVEPPAPAKHEHIWPAPRQEWVWDAYSFRRRCITCGYDETADRLRAAP